MGFFAGKQNYRPLYAKGWKIIRQPAYLGLCIIVDIKINTKNNVKIKATFCRCSMDSCAALLGEKNRSWACVLWSWGHMVHSP